MRTQHHSLSVCRVFLPGCATFRACASRIATCQCALIIIIDIPLHCLTLSGLFGLIETPCTEPSAKAAGIIQVLEVGQEKYMAATSESDSGSQRKRESYIRCSYARLNVLQRGEPCAVRGHGISIKFQECLAKAIRTPLLAKAQTVFRCSIFASPRA